MFGILYFVLFFLIRRFISYPITKEIIIVVLGQKVFITNEDDIENKILDHLWELKDYFNYFMVNFRFIGQTSITPKNIVIIWDRIQMVSF